MTEDEAKTKWCPHVRVAAGFRELAYNRAQNDSPIKHTACIGSACMAWRWKWDAGGGDAVEEHRKPSGQGDGYCGLAGKP